MTDRTQTPTDPYPDYVTHDELGDLVGSKSSASAVVKEHEHKKNPHGIYASGAQVAAQVAEHAKDHARYTTGAQVDAKVADHAKNGKHRGLATPEDIGTAVEIHNVAYDAHPGSASLEDVKRLIDALPAPVEAPSTDPAVKLVDVHQQADDPHGDRAYADNIVHALAVQRAAVTEAFRVLEARIAKLEGR